MDTINIRDNSSSSREAIIGQGRQQQHLTTTVDIGKRWVGCSRDKRNITDCSNSMKASNSRNAINSRDVNNSIKQPNQDCQQLKGRQQ